MYTADISYYGVHFEARGDAKCVHPETFWYVTSMLIGCRLCGSILLQG